MLQIRVQSSLTSFTVSLSEVLEEQSDNENKMTASIAINNYIEVHDHAECKHTLNSNIKLHYMMH